MVNMTCTGETKNLVRKTKCTDHLEDLGVMIKMGLEKLHIQCLPHVLVIYDVRGIMFLQTRLWISESWRYNHYVCCRGHSIVKTLGLEYGKCR
jgi:hypothetical protein